MYGTTNNIVLLPCVFIGRQNISFLPSNINCWSIAPSSRDGFQAREKLSSCYPLASRWGESAVVCLSVDVPFVFSSPVKIAVMFVSGDSCEGERSRHILYLELNPKTATQPLGSENLLISYTLYKQKLLHIPILISRYESLLRARISDVQITVLNTSLFSLAYRHIHFS